MIFVDKKMITIIIPGLPGHIIPVRKFLILGTKIEAMLGTLSETEMNNLLTRQAVGRIGYNDGKRNYITPVTYVYDGKYIYGQTNHGLKLEIMRKNHSVCFEVDAMSSMSNWESVIIHGEFEELFGDKAIEARKFLYNNILDLMTADTVHTHEHGVDELADNPNRIKEIMYRIKIIEKEGRFQRR